MNPVAWVSLGIVAALCGGIVWEAVAAVRKERRDAAIRAHRDEAYHAGFADGHDTDAKTARLARRGRVLGR